MSSIERVPFGAPFIYVKAIVHHSRYDQYPPTQPQFQIWQ